MKAIERYRAGRTTRGDAERALTECDDHLLDWRALFFAARAGVTVEGTVTAIGEGEMRVGYVFADMDHAIPLYCRSVPGATVGDRVSVTVALLGKGNDDAR